MTESPSALVAAARHLAQWGRSRQTAWHDPSSDLLAALGDRYASFDALQSDAPPPPLPPPPRPQPVMPPAIAAPVPRIVPVAPVAPPPVLPVAPIAAPVRAARVATGTPPATRRRRLPVARVLTAAAVVLAAVASPSLWRTYEASRVVVPTTNSLTVESTPPGALVSIDGVEAGTTPLTTALIVGVHQVELRYRKNVRTIDVDVVAGDPMVTRVDWTRRPAAPKKRPAARGAATEREPRAAAPASAPAAAAAPAPAVVETPPSSPPASGAPADDRPDTTEPPVEPGAAVEPVTPPAPPLP